MQKHETPKNTLIYKSIYPVLMTTECSKNKTLSKMLFTVASHSTGGGLWTNLVQDHTPTLQSIHSPSLHKVEIS